MATPGSGVSRKEKTSTLLLCLFLGVFGAHRFYVGKRKSATAMVWLGILGLFIGVGGEMAIGMVMLSVVVLWVILDLIMISFDKFHDRNGRPIVGAVHRLARQPSAPVDTRPHWERPSEEAASSGGSARLQQRILIAAKQGDGALTPNVLAMRIGIRIDAAKEHLESMVDKGYAELQVTTDGMIVYVFRDLLTEEKRDQLELI